MIRATSFVPYLGLLAIFIAIRFQPADAILAYDCSSTITNMTTIALLDIDECDLKTDNVETSEERIGLLQLNEFDKLQIYQCKIDVKRIIYNCGTSSDSSIVPEEFHSYIEAISKEDCIKAVKTLSLNFKGSSIDNLKLNEANQRNLIFTGMVDNDGICRGAEYKDMFGYWKNVAATGSVTITLNSERASVKLEDNVIFLPSGVHCKFSKGQCMDPKGGYTFWDSLPKKNCGSHSYTKLYEGPATKLKSNDETIYTVNAMETTFSFTVAGSETSCNMTLLKTESPKLLIVDSYNLEHLKKSNIIKKHSGNMDIFQYINSDFVYVEKEEKKSLVDTLAIAVTQPDVFAFTLMGGPGYMAVLAGEVIHIVECLPVEVPYREVEKCYNRLPVSRGNESMFMTPRTHILVKNANEIPCNGALMEQYKLENKWYVLKPELEKTKEPLRLKQIAKMNNLRNSGIYSDKDLDLLRETIMFPVEQVAIRETLSQLFSNNMEGPISVENSLLNYVLNQMFPDLWSTIWTPFSLFGSVSAGLAGLFMLLKLVTFFLDVLANAYMLYTVYGWSFRLFGAFWISYVNVTLREVEKKEEEKEEMMELEKRKKLQNKN